MCSSIDLPLNLTVDLGVDNAGRDHVRQEEEQGAEAATLNQPQFNDGRHSRPVRTQEGDGSKHSGQGWRDEGQDENSIKRFICQNSSKSIDWLIEDILHAPSTMSGDLRA